MTFASEKAAKASVVKILKMLPAPQLWKGRVWRSNLTDWHCSLHSGHIYLRWYKDTTNRLLFHAVATDVKYAAGCPAAVYPGDQRYKEPEDAIDAAVKAVLDYKATQDTWMNQLFAEAAGVCIDRTKTLPRYTTRSKHKKATYSR